MGICKHTKPQNNENNISSSPPPLIKFRAPPSQRRLLKEKQNPVPTFRYADAIQKNPNIFNKDYEISYESFEHSYLQTQLKYCLHIHSNTRRIVKIIKKNEDKIGLQALKEVYLLKQLDHPNILKVIEFYEEDDTIYVIYENFTGLKFLDHIIKSKVQDENSIADLIKQVLQTLNYLHNKKIIYRGINSQSLFCDEKKSIKFIDFSCATHMEDYLISEQIGNLNYRSPEMLRNAYNMKTDLWSVGVLTYFLLSQTMPFSGFSVDRVRLAIHKGVYSYDLHCWDQISKEAKEFIDNLLRYDFTKRWTAAEALKSNWIQSARQSISEPQVRNALQNMKKFQQNQILIEVISLHIVNECMSMEERDNLRKIFNALDTNQDGKLSPQEIQKGFSKYLTDQNAQFTKAEIALIMGHLDKNNNGFMDFTEFMMACQDQKKILTAKKLEYLFDQLDKDKSGVLSREEVRMLLGGNKITQQQWDYIVASSILKTQSELTKEQFIILVQDAMAKAMK